MSFKVKEWVEKVKVVTPGLKDNGPDWKPTPNERNTQMLKEARTYSWALIAMHRDLTNWDKNVKVTLNSIALLLKTGLPRIFDEAASGAAFPATREHRLVASDVPTEVLQGASTLLREKMSRDVLKPLEQWLEAYKKIREDNDRVEELRSELDTRRRSHAQVQYKVDKYTAAVSSPRAGDAAPESPEAVKMDATVGKLEEKTVQLEKEEDKTARMAQRYADAEAHVFSAIYALIQDVHVLRDYAAAAITLMQNAFASSLRAFQDGTAASQEEWTAPVVVFTSHFTGNPLVAKSPLQDRVGGGGSARATSEELTDGRAQLSFSPLSKQRDATSPTAGSPLI